MAARKTAAGRKTKTAETKSQTRSAKPKRGGKIGGGGAPGHTKRTEEEVIHALQASAGIVTLAAQKLGVSRQTVYNYLEKSEAIQKAREDIDEEVKDLAEAGILNQIRAEHPSILIFFAKTKMKDRGYIERQEVTGVGGGPVRTTEEPALDLSMLTDEELDNLKKIYEKATPRPVAPSSERSAQGRRPRKGKA